MITPAFSEAQAAHALEVVLRLMREHRFFLYRHDLKSFEGDLGYELDPSVFGPALELDSKIRAAYAKARLVAEESILQAERELGVAKANLEDNKILVQCKRHTGGLDICRVYPLNAFASYVPDSLEILTQQVLRELMDGKTADDLSPKIDREYRLKASELALIIWEQLEALGVRDLRNERCVVMMQTRFSCGSSDENRDFMYGKVSSMQESPHAMGYLFYEYSKSTRIVRHNHVVFSTSRRSHVNVQHWIDEAEPTIKYEADGGYSCPVLFVTVL